MPAAVYVRGYVMEYARALRIDAQRVVDSYLARYRKGVATPQPASAPE
jgi:cytoskeletal protein RodZ